MISVLNDEKKYSKKHGRDREENTKREEATIAQMLASPGNILATELSSGIAFDVQLFEHAV